MLQSRGNEARTGAHTAARPATQTFVLEAHAPRAQIAVGASADRAAKRSYESTLVGLAPPPIEYAPVAIHVQAPTRRPVHMPPSARDDRRLAAVLVVGTLIAMFAIAFSAVPGVSTRSGTPRQEKPRAASVEQPSTQALTSKAVIADAAPPAVIAIDEAKLQADLVRTSNGKVSRTAAARSKVATKLEPKRRLKPSRD